MSKWISKILIHILNGGGDLPPLMFPLPMTFTFFQGSKHPLGSSSYMVHQRFEYAKKFFPVTSKVKGL